MVWVSSDSDSDAAIKPLSRICFTTLNDRVGSRVKNPDPVPSLVCDRRIAIGFVDSINAPLRLLQIYNKYDIRMRRYGFTHAHLYNI